MAKQQMVNVLICIILGVANSVKEHSDSAYLDEMSVGSMARMFSRSAKVHQESMDSISRNLTLEKS